VLFVFFVVADAPLIDPLCSPLDCRSSQPQGKTGQWFYHEEREEHEEAKQRHGPTCISPLSPEERKGKHKTLGY
jgi:hypothetical protein